MSFTHRLCFLSYLERRDCTSTETSGKSAYANRLRVRVGRELFTANPWITLPSAVCDLCGRYCGHERQVASESQTRLRAPETTLRVGREGKAAEA